MTVTLALFDVDQTGRIFHVLSWLTYYLHPIESITVDSDLVKGCGTLCTPIYVSLPSLLQSVVYEPISSPIRFAVQRSSLVFFPPIVSRIPSRLPVLRYATNYHVQISRRFAFLRNTPQWCVYLNLSVQSMGDRFLYISRFAWSLGTRFGWHGFCGPFRNVSVLTP